MRVDFQTQSQEKILYCPEGVRTVQLEEKTIYELNLLLLCDSGQKEKVHLGNFVLTGCIGLESKGIGTLNLYTTKSVWILGKTT